MWGRLLSEKCARRLPVGPVLEGRPSEGVRESHDLERLHIAGGPQAVIKIPPCLTVLLF